MISVDAFYTPTWLADELINSVSFSGVPKIVADLAVGDGALLRSAKQKWSESKFVANDISTLKSVEMGNQNPDWLVSNFDFLSNKKEFIRYLSKYICIACGVDVILLNPPFSCRGSKRILIEYNETSILCSVALSFVVNSLSLLSASGECICILPNSCLSSEKDSAALELVRKDFDIIPLKKICSKTFDNCSASTTIVKIKRKSSFDTEPFILDKVTNMDDAVYSDNLLATVFRGKIKVDKYLSLVDKKSAIPFIHTTDINEVITIRRHISKSLNYKVVDCPAILIPRVGKPLASKLILRKKTSPICISDCIIAIKFARLSDAIAAYKRITQQWIALQNIYDGTCAQYTTVKKVKLFLESINIAVNVE